MSTAAPLRALIVEDDADIGQLVARYLQKAGFVATVLTSGRDVLAQARREPPDVLLLDVMLPGMDGLELCRALRTDTATALVPIILLTARDGEDERIAGLETGADDYITKPFSPKEVVARVRALLRRTHRIAPSAPTLTYGPLSVDVERHVVRHGGEDIHITAKEFLLLQYLLEHRGRVLSRDLLLTDVWGYAYTGGTRTVDVHIRRLREKLPVLVDAIVTIKQFGYKLLDLPPTS
ncbi:MAG: response regulator transcription factor [Acidobacteria bacterium]|nr:response regulator transcription factor [Acidobacteriota bacterium]